MSDDMAINAFVALISCSESDVETTRVSRLKWLFDIAVGLEYTI